LFPIRFAVELRTDDINVEVPRRHEEHERTVSDVMVETMVAAIEHALAPVRTTELG